MPWKRGPKGHSGCGHSQPRARPPPCAYGAAGELQLCTASPTLSTENPRLPAPVQPVRAEAMSMGTSGPRREGSPPTMLMGEVSQGDADHPQVATTAGTTDSNGQWPLQAANPDSSAGNITESLRPITTPPAALSSTPTCRSLYRPKESCTPGPSPGRLTGAPQPSFGSCTQEDTTELQPAAHRVTRSL